MALLDTTWGKACAGAGIALGLLLVVDGMLQISGFGASELYEGDPNTAWWLRPDLDVEIDGPESSFHLQTNSLGLRGSLPPQEGDWTLALGCSTTLGWGVEADEAWPAQLSTLIGEPVVNGGQPGWSTHQAVAHAETWLELGPSRVIIGYIIRDAQHASRPDSAANASPWWSRSGLMGLLRHARGRTEMPHAVGSVDSSRVPPSAYRDNLARLIEMSGDAEVILLSFPHQEAMTDWERVQSELGRTWAPRLEDEAFFASDPIHLSADGHRQLAEWMATELKKNPGA